MYRDERGWMDMYQCSTTFTLLSSGFKGIGVVILCVPCFAAFLIDAHRVLTPQEAATIFRDMASPLLLTTLGVTIYGFQTPERWYSGTFDYIGHSHNLHHVWTIIFAYLMLRNVLNWSQWRANDQEELPMWSREQIGRQFLPRKNLFLLRTVPIPKNSVQLCIILPEDTSCLLIKKKTVPKVSYCTSWLAG